MGREREREEQRKGRGGGRRKGGKKGEREKNSKDSDSHTVISLKDRTKAVGAKAQVFQTHVQWGSWLLPTTHDA